MTTGRKLSIGRYFALYTTSDCRFVASAILARWGCCLSIFSKKQRTSLPFSKQLIYMGNRMSTSSLL
ncbi:hypothetical protein, partial [Cupriavidus basilensis]